MLENISKKVGIITQARMASTRLPGKVMLKINDRVMLDYQVKRLEKVCVPLIIATTTDNVDDIIVDYALNAGVKYFRGDENNVLSRYYQCAKENLLDIIIRVTSDCPLIDGELIKKGLGRYMQIGHPKVYLSNCLKRTYPRGFDFEIFSFQLLEEAQKNARLQSDLEHVTPYIFSNHSGDVRLVDFVNNYDQSRFRITVDTTEDFNLVSRLISEFGADEMNAGQIVEILEKHPELVAINACTQQKVI